MTKFVYYPMQGSRKVCAFLNTTSCYRPILLLLLLSIGCALSDTRSSDASTSSKSATSSFTDSLKKPITRGPTVPM